MRVLFLMFVFTFGFNACSQDSSTEIQESGGDASTEMAETVSETPESMTAAPVTSETIESELAATEGNPTVIMNTNKGAITIELWADKAPISTENFLQYVDAGFYDGLIFHRVIPGFMIQGGGFDQDMVQKSNFPPIKNEARSDVPNSRGTLAMARTNVVDSATSQFFINLVDNNFLNHTDETSRGFGYAVFGEVIEGMDVVDAIAGVSTGQVRSYSDVPTEPVIIHSASRKN